LNSPVLPKIMRAIHSMSWFAVLTLTGSAIRADPTGTADATFSTPSTGWSIGFADVEDDGGTYTASDSSNPGTGTASISVTRTLGDRPATMSGAVYMHQRIINNWSPYLDLEVTITLHATASVNAFWQAAQGTASYLGGAKTNSVQATGADVAAPNLPDLSTSDIATIDVSCAYANTDNGSFDAWLHIGGYASLSGS